MSLGFRNSRNSKQSNSQEWKNSNEETGKNTRNENNTTIDIPLPYSGVEPDRSPFRFTAIRSQVITTYNLRKCRHRHGPMAACNHELH